MFKQERMFSENPEQNIDERFMAECIPGIMGAPRALLNDALPQILPHKSTDIKVFSDYIETLIQHQLYEEASETILQEASEIICQGLQHFKWLLELQKLMGQLTCYSDVPPIPLPQVYAELLKECDKS